MITGSCLCEEIQFKFEAPLLINHCHCSMCRKAHGAAFASFVHVKADNFHWLKGNHLISTYTSPTKNKRCFCGSCGSNVPVVEISENNVIIPAGTLNNDPGIKPSVHIFTSSKAPWFKICDSLPQFAEFPSEKWYRQFEED